MKKLNRKVKPWFWWVVLAASLGFIFMLTAFQIFTGEHSKNEIQQIIGMTEQNAYLTNAIARKSAHILIFGFLGILFYIVIKKRTIWYAWFCTVLVAILDEWHQSFVPGRSPLIQDVLLDSLAAFLFLIIVAFFTRR
jgi:VanZ family protein